MHGRAMVYEEATENSTRKATWRPDKTETFITLARRERKAAKLILIVHVKQETRFLWSKCFVFLQNVEQIAKILAKKCASHHFSSLACWWAKKTR